MVKMPSSHLPRSSDRFGHCSISRLARCPVLGLAIPRAHLVYPVQLEHTNVSSSSITKLRNQSQLGEGQTCADIKCARMILQICAHTWQVDNHVNVKPFKHFRLTDTAELK